MLCTLKVIHLTAIINRASLQTTRGARSLVKPQGLHEGISPKLRVSESPRMII